MDASLIERNSGDGTACSRCGRPLTTNRGACLETRAGGEYICEDCYREMLVPGAGDAHGNMS
jgi:hypothetical protein